MFEFISNNWALIATALFAISEIMALVPSIKSSGIFDLVYNLLKKAAGK